MHRRHFLETAGLLFQAAPPLPTPRETVSVSYQVQPTKGKVLAAFGARGE